MLRTFHQVDLVQPGEQLVEDDVIFAAQLLDQDLKRTLICTLVVLLFA